MSHPRLLPFAAAAASVALLAAGCGNAIDTEIIGMTAVTVDDSGRPVVLAEICSGDIDRVQVFGGREGLEPDDPNPELGSWEAKQPQSGSVSISMAPRTVAVSTSAWTASKPVAFALPQHYIVYASSSEADAETMQVDFEGSDLSALRPDQVIVKDGRVWTRDRFDDQACEGL